jgi:DNA polymerase III epsilon subunit-like protein
MQDKEIIFFDSEFTNLNPYIGEILSIGMVKENGEKLYIELDCSAECSDWVKNNILPTLGKEKVSREEAVRMIIDFVGKDKPIMIANVNQYDTIYLYKLFNGPETPFFWVPIDFASILFEKGYEPEDYINRGRIFKEFGIDINRYNQHNALDDAELLRETYLALKKKMNLPE